MFKCQSSTSGISPTSTFSEPPTPIGTVSKMNHEMFVELLKYGVANLVLDGLLMDPIMPDGLAALATSAYRVTSP